MDAAGVDRQVLSPIPPLICDFGDPAQAVQWTTHLNGAVAALVANNPNRFSGLGTVPLHHPDRAIQVLQRVHDDGLSGVEIGTSAGVRELDHPDLREFFQAAEQLGMLVFVHPLALGLDAYAAQLRRTRRLLGPVGRVDRYRLRCPTTEFVALHRCSGTAVATSRPTNPR
jgi:predicted TIM-barrel fold metal-dependent hydrolase